MTVASMHRISLTATVLLPALGLLSGSAALQYATLLYIGAIVTGVWGLHQRQRSGFRTIVVHLCTVGVLLGALLSLRHSPVDAGLVVVMAGMINRFYLRKGHRDDLILVGASGVLLTAATVITPGFLFAVILVLFMPSVLWAMLSASILGLSDRCPQVVHRPAPALGWTLTSWGLLLMLVGYVAVSFLPRYRFAQYFAPGGLIRFSNVSSQMTLSMDGGPMKSQGTVELRVYGLRPNAAVDGLYARLYALDHFDGRSFIDSKGRVSVHPTANSSEAEACSTLVALHRQVPRHMPHPVAVLGRGQPTQVYMPQVQAYASGTWVTRIPSGALDLRYQSCLDRFPMAPMAMAPTVSDQADGYISRYLELPKNLDSRVPQLAKELAGEASSTGQIIDRLLQHFADAYRYQLDALDGTSQDPLVRFLFEAKAGHCELFAGAMVVLLRLNDIPARVAAGYYGGHLNRQNHQLEFTSEDAHAWVEVLVDGHWRWIDATPEQERTRRKEAGFAWAKDVWNALEGWWYEYVINFDDDRRKAMVGSLKSFVFGFGEWTADQARSGGPGRSTVGTKLSLPAWAGVGGVFVVVAFGGSLLYCWRKHTELRRLGRKLRGSLGGGHQPLTILAAGLPEALAPWANQAVQRYEAYRYGDHTSPRELAELRRCSREWFKVCAQYRRAQRRKNMKRNVGLRGC